MINKIKALNKIVYKYFSKKNQSILFLEYNNLNYNLKIRIYYFFEKNRVIINYK